MLPNYHCNISENPTSLIASKKCNIGSESLRFTQTVAFFYLSFNSVGTIYRAYINDDIPMVAFIIFVYFGYFLLDHCLTVFNRLPSHEESPRKELLKVTIWSLSSAILFGFSYQFSTFMSPVVVLPLYGMATVSSAFLFYVHFIYDDRRGYRACCRVESTNILHVSGPIDKDIERGISTLEKV